MKSRLQRLYNNNSITSKEIYRAYLSGSITLSEYEDMKSEIFTGTLSFSKLKEKTLLRLEEWYETIISSGYSVQGKNFNLAMRFDDRNSFTQQLTLIQTLYSNGSIPGNYEHSVLDVNNVEHKLTTLELLSTLPSYGVYVSLAWSTKTGYETYINSLSDTTQNRDILTNITFSL